MSPITIDNEMAREAQLREQAISSQPANKTIEQIIQNIEATNERIKNNPKLYLVVDSTKSSPTQN